MDEQEWTRVPAPRRFAADARRHAGVMEGAIGGVIEGAIQGVIEGGSRA